jgi:hypothetical protein
MIKNKLLSSACILRLKWSKIQQDILKNINKFVES